MLVLARRIEHSLDLAVQAVHEANTREHRRATLLCNKDQRLHCGLPFWRVVLGFWELGYVERGVT